MQDKDLNLLPVLQALLAEESVTRAAARLHLSVPATSRALDRCRQTFGDPLLVREGRGLVMTPRARQLNTELGPLLDQVAGVIAPAGAFDPATLERSFVVRSNETVIAVLGSRLLELVGQGAPRVSLRFEQESVEDLEAVRSGQVSLLVGSYSAVTRDFDTELLAVERLVGVVRAGHPVLEGRMTRRAFAALDHVVTSRRGVAKGPIDRDLAHHGLQRRIAAVVPSFSSALAMTVRSDLTALAPAHLVSLLGQPAGLVSFRPPMRLPTVEVHQIWHGRDTTDPGHRWLRRCVTAARTDRP